MRCSPAPKSAGTGPPLLSVELWAGSRRGSALLLALFSVACFGCSLTGDFVFDDAEAIVNNPDVSGGAPLSDVWRNDFWGRSLRSNKSHKSFRPLTTLSFRANHWASGSSTWSYHCVNVALHLAVSVLALRVYGAVLRDCVGESRPALALLAALVFATHPVHTECVANVVGRAELLCAVFFLAGFLAFHRAVEERSGAALAATVAAAAAALLCKEQGLTLLALCGAYEVLVKSKVTLKRVLQTLAQQAADRANNNSCKDGDTFMNEEMKPMLWRLGVLCSSGFALGFARLWVMDFQAPNFSEPDNPASFHPNPIVRAVNYGHVYLLNAWLLTSPDWLCFDYSMGCIPLITSPTDARLLPLAAFAALIVAATTAFLRWPSSPQKSLVLSCAVFAAVPFVPASNLVVRVGFVVAERVLYLPSLGTSLLVALGASRLEARRVLSREQLGLGLAALLLAFSAKSAHRSWEWSREVRLFSAGSRVCPRNAKVHYNLGKVLGDAGDLHLAAQEYRLALRLEPAYEQAMNNLANILKDFGEQQEAKRLLAQAVRIRPDFAAAWMNLGIVETALGSYAEAEAAYRRALSERRVYPDALFNLGNLYLETGRKWEALAAWRNASGLQATHAKAWLNQLVLLDAEGDWDAAADAGRAALAALPAVHASRPALHAALGSALAKGADFPGAERHLRAALEARPSHAPYSANLGVLFHRWGRLREAESAYKAALALDPDLAQAAANLRLLRKKAKVL